MARTKADPTVVRPSCLEHPGSRVRLDGYRRCEWSDVHRRPRYRCVTVPGTRGHSFSVPVAVRQPTERHPDSGLACPTCEHIYGRHEGVKTGRDFVFGHTEIARLFLRVGEGMSLRAASRELRESVFRFCHRHRPTRPFRSTRPGDTSRQANLAVNYLDAFAPAIIAALHPTAWPRVLVLDTTTLFTRGYRRPRRGPAEAEPAEVRVGNLKAGTILIALDGTARGARPCLMRVAGGKDVESWRSSRRSRGHQRSLSPTSTRRSAGPSARRGRPRSSCRRDTTSLRSCASGRSPTGCPSGSGPTLLSPSAGRCRGPVSA